MPRQEDEHPIEKIIASLFTGMSDESAWRSLSWPEQVVVLVHGAQGIIDNGGLVYFYENDWPGNPSYALFADAYASIGATEMAGCIKSTAALFPFPEPHLDCELRLVYLEKHKADATGVFMQCDEFAVGQGEQVYALLAVYIREQGLAPAS